MNEIRHIYKQLLLIIEWYNDMSGNLKYLCMKLIDTDLRIRAGTAVKRRIELRRQTSVPHTITQKFNYSFITFISERRKIFVIMQAYIK